jgi:ABC-type bacteriocin/lantibiotic exporter with double-glycine peptidase domain
MTAGLVICCSILATRIAQPFTRLAIAWAELETEATAAARHAVCRRTTTVAADEIRQNGARSGPARVEIKGAAATYEASDARAVDDVDLVIAPGECITIVGNDSSAKLSLLRLIAGEGAPAQGTVLIDDEPATSASRTGISAVALLSELPGMTQDTILANITLHRPWIGTERARGAARLVGLEPDILRLPAGYETRLSGGTSADLPSGMRKRIGLARTVAGAPRLLILSEPQVGLDLAAQGQLESLIAGIKGRCTIVMTTNAPRLVRCGDRIFELRDGRLAQVAVRPQVQPGAQPLAAVQGAAA